MKNIFGIKGFDKDLQCRGKRYEIGQTYTIEELPKLCNRGFHYCKNITDCFNYYRNDGLNRFCIVEILGDIDNGVDKCATNKIKIVKELNFEEINRGKDITELRMKQLNDMGYVIGGSMGLLIQGYKLERKPTDIDLITLKPDAETIKKDFEGYASLNVFSGADTTYACKGYMGEKYDIIKSSQIYPVKRVYNGIELTVQDAKVIWEAKLNYALQGSLKHINDIKYCGIKFTMINDKINIYDNLLPF